MAIQLYTATPLPIETLLAWEKSGEIAIPAHGGEDQGVF